jgi:phage replication O-like protein O
MASPQLENGYLRLSNELAEAICRTPFNGSQARIVMAIIRETYGNFKGRKIARLSLQRISNATGIDMRNVQREVGRLRATNVVMRAGQEGQFFYGIQKDYDKWSVPKRKGQDGVGEFANGEPTNGESTKGETASSPSEGMVNSPTHIKKQAILKKVRTKKAHADPRFQPIKEHYLKRTLEATKAKAPFAPRDGKALSDFLAANQEAPRVEIIRWLDNAFDSSDQYPLRRGFRMAEFCWHYAKYTRGPLLKGNHRSASAQPPTLVGAADPRRQLSAEGEKLYEKFRQEAAQ